MLYIVSMKNKSKTFHLGIRINEEMKNKLDKLASKNRRKTSDYCRIVLEDHIKDKSAQ